MQVPLHIEQSGFKFLALRVKGLKAVPGAFWNTAFTSPYLQLKKKKKKKIKWGSFLHFCSHTQRGYFTGQSLLPAPVLQVHSSFICQTGQTQICLHKEAVSNKRCPYVQRHIGGGSNTTEWL